MNWREYWETFPRRFDEREFCRQVGRTAHGGKPTSDDELAKVVAQMVEGVELEPTSMVLDLCCGNGLLTRRLAGRCGGAVGVDFSGPMIDLARRHHAADDVAYLQASVLELRPETFERVGAPAFDRVSMFESLQYFTPEQLPALLDGLRRVCNPDVVAYFSGVLDRDRIWSFFDTPKRREAYEQQRREGREIMGHWWDAGDIEAAAERHGFSVAFVPQDPSLNTAHYRFDVKLRSRG